ncbi:MAG: hypothetical protein WC376_00920 [Candidatus Nanoarchaeia archaeon]|jgi:predicted GTPase
MIINAAEAEHDIEHILKVYDIGGQERYKFLIESKEYSMVKGANLIINVINGKNYLGSLKYLNSIQGIKESYNNLYVATRYDLMEPEDFEEINTLNKFIDFPVFYVSNKDGTNIDNLLNAIISVVSAPGNYRPRNADNTLRESKIVFTGQGGVGKTSLFVRLKENRFLENAKLTIGQSINTFRVNYKQIF